MNSIAVTTYYTLRTRRGEAASEGLLYIRIKLHRSIHDILHEPLSTQQNSEHLYFLIKSALFILVIENGNGNG